MSTPHKFLFVGVGGQGVLTSARVLGQAAVRAGLPVRVGQVHGMSQRGGSVEATLVFGPGETGFVARGEADVLIGLEALEALRAVPRCSGRTLVLLEKEYIAPFQETLRGNDCPSPEVLCERIQEHTKLVLPIDAKHLAATAGDPRTLNTVMLGLLAGLELLPFEPAVLLATLEERLRPRSLEVNRRAFASGLELGRDLAPRVGEASHTG